MKNSSSSATLAEALAGQVEGEAVQAFRAGPVGDALHPHDQEVGGGAAGLAHVGELDAAAVGADQRPVGRDGLRVAGVGFQPDLAVEPVRPAELAHLDEARVGGRQGRVGLGPRPVGRGGRIAADAAGARTAAAVTVG